MRTLLARHLQRRRLERLHKRLQDPACLTLAVFEEACRLLGCDPDDVRAGRAELPQHPPPLSQAQAFLDLTHPGHGLRLAEIPTGDAERVAAVAATNFMWLCAERWARQQSDSPPSRPAAS